MIVGAFILGGIGFPVVFELARHPRRPAAWSLHTRTTLSTNALLLALGTLMIAAVERNNDDTLGALGWADRPLPSPSSRRQPARQASTPSTSGPCNRRPGSFDGTVRSRSRVGTFRSVCNGKPWRS